MAPLSVLAAGRVERRARGFARLVEALRAVLGRRVADFRVVGLAVAAFVAAGLAAAGVVVLDLAVADLADAARVDAALLAAGLVVAAFRVDDFAAVALRVDADVGGVAVVGLDPAAGARVVDAARLVVPRFALARFVVARLVVVRLVVARFGRAAGVAAAELAAAVLVVADLEAVRFAPVRVVVFRVAVFRVVAGFRVTRRLADEAALAVRAATARGAPLIGETAFAAFEAAVPTPAAAPPSAPAAPPAAPPAAARARPPIRTTRPATSAAASAACRWRFATCLRPFVPSALASCASRFVSSARALSSCLPSFFSSRAALPVTGADACWAAVTTSPAATTTSAGRLDRFAVDASFVDFAMCGSPYHVFRRPMRGGRERYHSEINAERSAGPDTDIFLPRRRRGAAVVTVNEALTARQAAVDARVRA
ncbi:MAG: hypothetical protein K0S97_837 [Chloroflexota bacterium]|nr:hypothetical protein [Chloroflexota bacterium]